MKFSSKNAFRPAATALFGIALLAAGVSQAAASGVSLSGTEETPAVETAASGSGSIDVAADKSVSGKIVTSGIVGTVAHIHAGAPGQKGPPVITLTKVSDNEWAVPADARLSDEQYASYKAGNLYVNVHSSEHKGGEIRGQLKP